MASPLRRFFTKFGMGEELSGPQPSCQISLLSLLKCGLTASKIAEIGNSWYKFAENRFTPLSDF